MFPTETELTPLTGAGGGAGVTTVTTVGAITVKVTGVLFIEDRLAVMLAVPAATPMAKPAELIVATALLSLAQVTREVMSAVELSE